VTAAERLHAAADLLERTAASASPGPWQPEYALVSRQVQAVFVGCDGEDCPHDWYGHADGTCAIGSFEADDDNRWAILTNPRLAAPLAAWLRERASYSGAARDGNDRHALAVADVILGDAS
jgi:hypothetical protein